MSKDGKKTYPGLDVFLNVGHYMTEKDKKRRRILYKMKL